MRQNVGDPTRSPPSFRRSGSEDVLTPSAEVIIPGCSLTPEIEAGAACVTDRTPGPSFHPHGPQVSIVLDLEADVTDAKPSRAGRGVMVQRLDAPDRPTAAV